jgi:hypothetical protein
MVLIELVEEGTAARVDDGDEASTGKRRRLSRPTRRRSTPQDKPVQSQAAAAAAAGTPGPEGEVSPPETVIEETSEAAQDEAEAQVDDINKAVEGSEAEGDVSVAGGAGGAGGVPEGGLPEDKSDTN